MSSRQRVTLFMVLALMVLGVPRPAQAEQGATVDPVFSRYYWRSGGADILGMIESQPFTLDGRTAQYFEKARLEDHHAEAADALWAITYGRVVAELMVSAPTTPVGGTDCTYGDLAALAAPQPMPDGFVGGTLQVADGVFVPMSPDLGPAPGFVVPAVFWEYLTNPDHVPGGWMHDLGLPLTTASTVSAEKPDGPRPILLQAFERGILTYDPANPAEWQVERANVGTDALTAQGMAPLHVQPVPQPGSHSIEVSLSKQHLYAYDGDILVFDAPVSTGKDGFETPVGTFAITSKQLLRTMRGAEKGEHWVVPDVPHVMYFFRDFALHGTYWHNRFGTDERRSHGCVNLPLDAAAWLYRWAAVGTPVTILK